LVRMEPHWVYSHFRTKKDSLDNFIDSTNHQLALL
jgi:hypothetical protein